VSTKSTADLVAEFDAVDETASKTAEPTAEPTAAASDTGSDAKPAIGFRGPARDYNVAPTTWVRVVLNRPLHRRTEDTAVVPNAEPGTAVRQLRLAHWGLIPSWAKDATTGNRMFNARAESIAGKPAFRRAFAKRRCLVPADGWYEWRRMPGPDGKPMKQPFLMRPGDDHSITFAGLYEFWRPAPDEPLVLSVTVITVAAQGELAEIHERMPHVLSPADYARWLDPADQSPVTLLEPRDEARIEHLQLVPVSTRVNDVHNNGPELLEPVQPVVESQVLF
jgi:putative SOS response-associated peptidase YedK